MRPAALALVLVACGRVDFDPRSTDGGAADCWPAWRAQTIDLTTPTLITELSTGEIQANPSLSGDDLTLYFDRGTADPDLFAATRSAIGAPWQSAMPLTELNSTATEDRMTVSADGEIAIFSSDRSNGDMQLWMATRAGATGPFSAPTQALLELLNVDEFELDPNLTGDGLQIYEAPVVSGGDQVIEIAARTTTSAAFDTAIAIPELSISSAVGDPSPSPDQLVIAFSSGVVSSENDLYYAVRADVGSPFGTALPIPNVNLANINDGDVTWSHDGCELFFASDRDGVRALYTALAR